MERDCKNLNKTWSNLKQLAQSRVRWRVGVVDEIKKIKKKNAATRIVLQPHKLVFEAAILNG